MLRALFWIAAVGSALLLPLMAWHGYPQTDGDTVWFLPAALAEARGDGLVNTLHLNAGSFDITGQNLFVFYPPGFPWLLGQLAAHTFGATAQGVYTTFASCASLFLLLAAFAFARWAAQRPAEKQREAWILSLAAFLALGTDAIAFAFGRPDTMATVVVMIGALCAVRFQRDLRFFIPILGILLGLLAFLHPVAAFFASALLGLWFSLRTSLRTTAFATLPVYALGVGAMLLLFAASPNGLHASFDGIERHAAATMVSGTWDDPHKDQPLKFLLLHSYATGYGLLVALAAGLLGLTVVRRWKEKKGTRIGIAFFLACLVVFLFHFVAAAWDRAYNLWVFTPVTLWVILILGGRECDRLESSKLRRIGYALTLGVFLICASGFLHRLLLFPAALADGAGSLKTERARALALLHDREPGLVIASKSLWLFFDANDDANQPHPVRAYALNPAQHFDIAPRYIVLQQRFTAYETAPQLPGFHKVWDDFTAEKPRFLGLPLSDTMPTYRFAFYERE